MPDKLNGNILTSGNKLGGVEDSVLDTVEPWPDVHIIAF